MRTRAEKHPVYFNYTFINILTLFVLFIITNCQQIGISSKAEGTEREMFFLGGGGGGFGWNGGGQKWV